MAVDSAIAGAKIIIVDDEWANVRLLERVLRNEGYSNIASITESGEIFDKQVLIGADLLLLDLHMPAPDGFMILEKLRQPEIREQIPILVLTADTTAASRNRALDIGATDYINKPFDPVEVLLRVRNLLRIRFLHLRLLKTNRLLHDRLLELEDE